MSDNKDYGEGMRPCPFCQRDELTISIASRSSIGSGDIERKIQCATCLIIFVMPSNATWREQWNRRTP